MKSNTKFLFDDLSNRNIILKYPSRLLLRHNKDGDLYEAETPLKDDKLPVWADERKHVQLFHYQAQ